VNIVSAVLVMVVVVSGALAHAENWSIAEQSDEAIKTLVAAYQKEYGGADIGRGAPAIYLAHRDNVYATSNAHKICYNRLLEAIDLDRGEFASQNMVFPRGAKITNTGFFILGSDGHIERIAKDLIQLRPGDDVVGPQVTFHFPAIKTGDILGWSVVIDCGWGYSGAVYIPAVLEFPVRYRQIRVTSEGSNAYRIIGYNIEKGKGGIHVYDTKGGVPTDVCIIFLNLGVWKGGFATPPYALRNPYCTIFQSAKYMSIGGEESWISFSSSDYTAYLAGTVVLKPWQEPSIELTAAARVHTTGDGDASARLASLDRFVRDEFVLIRAMETGSDAREPASVLAGRNATSWEKGLLLANLASSVSIPVDIIFVRSTDYGPLDNEITSLSQYSDIVVRLRGKSDQYFAPSFANCPPGVLPVQLRGAPAISIQAVLEEKMRALQEEVFFEIGDSGRFLEVMSAKMSTQGWYTRFTTPGNPDDLSGALDEVIECDPTAGGWLLEVGTEGFTPLLDIVRQIEGPRERAEAYLSQRFSASVLEAQIALSDADSNHYRIKARLEHAPLPPASGDTWVLPPSEVYGTCEFAEWVGPDREPFYFDNTWTAKRTWRSPLPAGWNAVELPLPVRVEHPRFVYESTVSVTGRKLVVERSILFRRGLTRIKELPELHQAIVQVQQAERMPLVLVKSGR
jgi:hypothetical protein